MKLLVYGRSITNYYVNFFIMRYVCIVTNYNFFLNTFFSLFSGKKNINHNKIKFGSHHRCIYKLYSCYGDRKTMYTTANIITCSCCYRINCGRILILVLNQRDNEVKICQFDICIHWSELYIVHHFVVYDNFDWINYKRILQFGGIQTVGPCRKGNKLFVERNDVPRGDRSATPVRLGNLFFFRPLSNDHAL